MYTFVLLFLFSAYNSIVFFERKRTYQIFNSNIGELDNLYSINKKDETNFTRGNFFNERPRPGIPNFRKSVHPSNNTLYEKEHEKPFIIIRIFKMVKGMLEVVFHFLTVGALRNKRVRKSRLFNEREKVNRMTYEEKKKKEEIENRPANMTTYYDDMGPKIEPQQTNLSTPGTENNIYEIEMWEYSQYDRVLVTYFSPIQVLFLFAIYYFVNGIGSTAIMTKAVLVLCVYVQSIFLDRIMINLEKKESDKKIIYAQAQKEQIEFNNRFNQVKNHYLTNIIRENNINISLPTDYYPLHMVGNSITSSTNNGNNTDEIIEEEDEILLKERNTNQNKQAQTINTRREESNRRLPLSTPTVQSSSNQVVNPKQASSRNMQLTVNPSESSIFESRNEHTKIREEIRQQNLQDLDMDESRRNDNRKQPIVSSSITSSVDEENQKKRKESEGNIFQKHSRKKVKHD